MYASSASSPRRRSSSSSPPSPTSLEPTRRPLRQHGNPNSKSRILIKPRHVYAFIKIALPVTFFSILLGLYFYEPHIELAFYDRNWVTKEIEPVAPLAGCFDENRVSTSYNISQYVYGPKRTEVHSGMPMRMGMDCYNFAGTIKAERRLAGQSIAPEERTQYHTYWRNDLAPFGPRQEWMLKSFFATQDTSRSRLTLWSNGDLGSDNVILQTYLKRFPDAFAIKIADIPTLAKGTELDGSDLLTSKDAKAWVDGDLIRLLLLWNFGGIWVDMDSLLTRDLDPLLEHEFVTQWDCYGTLLSCPCATYTDSLTKTNSTFPLTAPSCASANIPPTSAKPFTSLQPPLPRAQAPRTGVQLSTSSSGGAC